MSLQNDARSSNEVVQPLVTMPVEARSVHATTEFVGTQVSRSSSPSPFISRTTKKLQVFLTPLFVLVVFVTSLFWIQKVIHVRGIIVPEGNELSADSGVPPRLVKPVQ